MINADQKLYQWQEEAFKQKELAFVKKIRKTYPKSGVYVVGGIVRDLLLGRESKDYDFVITNVTERQLLNFLRKLGKVNLVGKNFGVIKFTPNGMSEKNAIDIALPRIDKPGQGSGAYRDTTVVSRSDISIEEDLLRRDYTINALAWSVTEKKLIDIVGGVNDLEKKVLRTVGSPQRRFGEDYSRALRGLRFSATLNFKFEAKTWKALLATVKKLNKKNAGEYVVPREVIAAEFVKSLYLSPLDTINLYDKSGAFKVLMPEILTMKKCPQPLAFHTEGDVWKHSILSVQALFSKRYQKKYHDRPDAELIFTAFIHDIGKPPTLKTPRKHKVNRVRFDGHDVVGANVSRTIIERLKLSSLPSDTNLHIDADNVVWLIKNHLLLLNDNATNMKATTIEKYFVSHSMSLKLQQLMLVDTLASIPKSGRPVVSHLNKLEKVIAALPRTKDNMLPKPILSGDEIMRALKISAGPKVGQFLQQLREAQLAGKVRTKGEAKQYIKTL